jgi:hypothetical protein
MSRKVFGTAILLALVAGSSQPAKAQGFGMGYMDFGPVVGLGGIGDASLSFGGRFEKAIKPLPEIGNGVVGLGVGASYYSWSTSAGADEWSATYIPIGVTANYHFPLENKKLDPFLGLGLGYSIVSYDCPDSITAFCDSSSSALYFIGRAGVRWHLDKVALYADAGAGDATLNIGVMFRAKNGQ